MKFCSEVGQNDVWYSNSGKQQKVQGDKGKNVECEWSKLLKEKEITFAGGHRNGTVLFPPAVGDVDGYGPMGV